MNAFQKQIYYWTHMLDESTPGVERPPKILNERITEVDESIYGRILDFLKSLTPKNIDKAALEDRLTLADLIDLYNFQDGPYRTTRKSDLLVTAASDIFPELKPEFPIYRGTESENEVESMVKTGKTVVDHAISFSTDPERVLDFGDYTFVVEENDGAVCIDLQKYVSAFLQACTDFGVGFVYEFAKDKRKDALGRFQILATDEYLSKEDLAELDDLKRYSRAQTGKNTQTFYKLIEVTMKLREAGYDFASNPGITDKEIFDPVMMGDEGEVLVCSDTVFDFVRPSDEFKYGYVFRMRAPDRSGKSGPIRSAFFGKDRGLVFNDGVLTFSGYSISARAPVRKTSGINRLWIEHVKMADSVVAVDEYGFRDCKNLKSVQFGKKLQTIGEGAFIRCSKLEELTFPKSLKYIMSQAFTDSGVGHVAFAGGECEFEDEVFSRCQKLEYCALPAQTEYISPSMFMGCAALETVDGLENAKHIAEYAFGGCRNLKTVKISDGCRLREQAFGEACVEKLVMNGKCALDEYAFYNAVIQTLDLTNLRDGAEGKFIQDSFANCRVEKLICEEARRKKLVKALRDSGAIVMP